MPSENISVDESVCIKRFYFSEFLFPSYTIYNMLEVSGREFFCRPVPAHTRYGKSPGRTQNFIGYVSGREILLNFEQGTELVGREFII